jgi:hypothetical protein
MDIYISYTLKKMAQRGKKRVYVRRSVNAFFVELSFRYYSWHKKISRKKRTKRSATYI